MLEHTNPSPDPQPISWRSYPWWIIGVVIFLMILINQVVSDPLFNEAFHIVKAGLTTTLWVSFSSFILAIGLGYLVITGIRSPYAIWQNIGLFYLTLAGSIPLLLLIYIIAFLIVPYLAEVMGIDNSTISMANRFVLALVIFYSAFWVEMFFVQLGPYENINQDEGEKQKKSLRIFWPIPHRQIALLLGITLVGILKDSAWMSLLAVRDIAHFTRIYAGSTFHFGEAYLVALIFYLLLTIPFKYLIVNHYKVMGQPGNGWLT